MAVVDFRMGGFVGEQPRQVRDYPYGQDTQQDGGGDWQYRNAQWDDESDQLGGGTGPAGSVVDRLGRLTHYLGAVVSVGLMVMLAVWGYKLVMRDVSGVPIIRAMEGEARTAPDDPGGQLATRTGLAVNSVAGGVETRAANQVAIAPDTTRLSEEDVAMGDLGATARQPSRESEAPVHLALDPVVATSDAERRAAEELALSQAVTSVVPENEGPVNEAVTDLDGHVAAPEAIQAVLAEAAASVAPVTRTVTTSPRPAPRPRRVATAPATIANDATPAAASTQAAAPVQKVSASAITSGAALVQIGAFDSNALAEGEWNRISGKFGGLFSGKAQVIQKAESGGRNFWRLRVAGFENRDEARRFCADLIAGGTDCIPATAP